MPLHKGPEKPDERPLSVNPFYGEANPVGGMTEGTLTDREFWVEINRGIGHILKGFGTISAAITKRYVLGDRARGTPEAAQRR